MPRIYVASLSDYNAGNLHGAWIDAAQDIDDVWAEVNAMLSSSPEGHAEEFAIHDYEDFEGITLSEYEQLETVVMLASLLEEHGAAFAAYIDNEGLDYASKDWAVTVEGFEESFAGEHATEEAFAEELADELGAVPEDLTWPMSYIDWERAARDLFMGDYWSAPAPSGVYVFRSY